MQARELQIEQYQRIAKQLLRISKNLNQIYRDQMMVLGDLNAQNMFKIDQEQQCLEIANGMFSIKFHAPTQGQDAFFERNFHYQQHQADEIEEFILQDVYFLTGDLKAQHSLYLRNKAQHFRQLLIEFSYRLVDARQRVADFFHHISLVQAEIVDHLMMKEKLYKVPIMMGYVLYQQPIPDAVMHLMQDIFSLEYICGDQILPLQPLQDSLDELCFSAAQFLTKAAYRIMVLSFEERFNLHEMIEYQSDLSLLYRHAVEHSHLLGFVRLMNREKWHRADLLSKQHFLIKDENIWQKKVAKLPLFDYPRAVNWLFKQSAEVVDWLSQNVQHSSVRVTVIALSYLDCSRIHPQVILATLQYFQYASARIFIYCCVAMANKEHWFEHPNNKRVVFKDQCESVDDHRIAISPSILYLDEWMGLMHDVIGDDDLAVKRVYQRLSRVIQAYLLHLHRVTEQMPADVMPYIRLDTQQDRGFLLALQRHKIQLNDFRRLFYLNDRHARESVFDAYVRDYLTEYFQNNQHVPKNVTWTGLFFQAVQWHEDIQKKEMIAKLQSRYGKVVWTAFSAMKSIELNEWCFTELNSIDAILEESRIFHHCLAASYTSRIVEGEYVAFHMSHRLQEQHLTLGCHIQGRTLIFDQLEYANNQKADIEDIQIAQCFISWMNDNKSQPI